MEKLEMLIIIQHKRFHFISQQEVRRFLENLRKYGNLDLAYTSAIIRRKVITKKDIRNLRIKLR